MWFLPFPVDIDLHFLDTSRWSCGGGGGGSKTSSNYTFGKKKASRYVFEPMRERKIGALPHLVLAQDPPVTLLQGGHAAEPAYGIDTYK